MNTSLKNISKQCDNIEIKLNRLLAQRAKLKQNHMSVAKKEYKARTRTLIQLGGLLSLTPILDICNIKLGEDLQISAQDKADTFLGIISTLFDSLSNDFDASDLDHFKTIGSSLRLSHLMNKSGA